MVFTHFVSKTALGPWLLPGCLWVLPGMISASLWVPSWCLLDVSWVAATLMKGAIKAVRRWGILLCGSQRDLQCDIGKRGTGVSKCCCKDCSRASEILATVTRAGQSLVELAPTLRKPHGAMTEEVASSVESIHRTLSAPPGTDVELPTLHEAGPEDTRIDHSTFDETLTPCPSGEPEQIIAHEIPCASFDGDQFQDDALLRGQHIRRFRDFRIDHGTATGTWRLLVTGQNFSTFVSDAFPDLVLKLRDRKQDTAVRNVRADRFTTGLFNTLRDAVQDGMHPEVVRTLEVQDESLAQKFPAIVTLRLQVPDPLTMTPDNIADYVASVADLLRKAGNCGRHVEDARPVNFGWMPIDTQG